MSISRVCLPSCIFSMELPSRQWSAETVTIGATLVKQETGMADVSSMSDQDLQNELRAFEDDLGFGDGVL